LTGSSFLPWLWQNGVAHLDHFLHPFFWHLLIVLLAIITHTTIAATGWLNRATNNTYLQYMTLLLSDARKEYQKNTDLFQHLRYERSSPYYI
jgi:hypothetical protein